MKRLAVLITCLCIAGVAPQASATHGDPHGIPDAEYNEAYDGFSIFSSGNIATQSFTALRSGKVLAGQAFRVYRHAGTGPGCGLDVTMRLVNVDVNGQPEGTPLAETTIDGATIPAGVPGGYTTLTGYFGSAAPRVVAGQTYGLSITTSDCAQNSWDFKSGDPYAGGRANSDPDYDQLFKIWLVNKAPKITDVKPKPDSKIENRTPTIRARVRDSVTDLRKRDIRLFLDGNRKRAFDYDSVLDRLAFEPGRNLSYGNHRVRIKATDEHGQSTVRKWSFKIVE